MLSTEPNHLIMRRFQFRAGKNFAVIVLFCGILAHPPATLAEPPGSFLITNVSRLPGCCFEFAITETAGSDEYVSNIVVTVNTPGVTVSGAEGPAGEPAPVVRSTSVTFMAPFTEPPGFKSPTTFVTACFNNIPASGASVTFSANAYVFNCPSDHYVDPLTNITIGTNGECAVSNSMQLVCGADIVTNCADADGTVVSFPLLAAADGSCGLPVTVTASWPPLNVPYSAPTVTGTFQAGVTPVTITATDACGGSNSCTFTITVLSQGTPQGAWAFSDGGQNNLPGGTSQQGNGIAVDAMGNTFVAGTFFGSAVFTGAQPMYSSVNNGQPITLYSCGKGAGSDAFLAKYDSSGHLLWVTQAEACSSGSAGAVAVDSRGNCVMAGSFTGKVFPDYPADTCGDYGLYAMGSQDMFLAKFDPEGNLLWAASAGDSQNFTGITDAQGLAVDADDNCYVVGGYNQAVGFLNGINSSCLIFPDLVLYGVGGGHVGGDGDAYLAKYDLGGTFLWATGSTCSDSSASATFRGVAVKTIGSAGYAWVVGSLTGASVSLTGQTSGGMTAAPVDGYEDCFVALYTNLDGVLGPAVAWTRQVTSGCTNGTGSALCGTQDGRGIGADANGNCYFTAYFNGSAVLGALPPVIDQNPLGGPPLGFSQNQLNDYLVASLGLTGNARWIVNGGQLNDNESRALAVSPAGYVFVTGELGATTQFYSGGQNIMLNEYLSTTGGPPLLTETGVEALPPDEASAGLSVTVDAAGCFYVTGAFEDAGDSDSGLVFPGFDPQVPLIAPGGQQSIFVVKYCPACGSNGVVGSSCVSAPAGMVMWLPFDETTGTTSANLKAAAFPGARVGGPVVVPGQYVANSLNFNGVNQYVAVPDYPGIDIGTNALSIDTWVKRPHGAPDSPPSAILDKQDPLSGIGYGLFLNSGNLTLQLADSFGLLQAVDTVGSVPADGQWHFVAVTVNRASSTGGCFYVDGALTSTFNPSATQGSLANTSPLYVGASPAGGGVPWTGGLDEVEVFSRALSAGEIQNIFNAHTYGKCKPCCYQEQLTISIIGGAEVITWPSCGTLEKAPAVTGPWSAVANGSSPYTVPSPMPAVMFYRLKCD